MSDQTNPKKPILLVEDNADDEALTLRALKKKQHHQRRRGHARRSRGSRLSSGAHGPDKSNTNPLPMVILLDLKLPRLTGSTSFGRSGPTRGLSFCPW